VVDIILTSLILLTNHFACLHLDIVRRYDVSLPMFDDVLYVFRSSTFSRFQSDGRWYVQALIAVLVTRHYALTNIATGTIIPVDLYTTYLLPPSVSLKIMIIFIFTLKSDFSPVESGPSQSRSGTIIILYKKSLYIFCNLKKSHNIPRGTCRVLVSTRPVLILYSRDII
jgi:hypothetical protein